MPADRTNILFITSDQQHWCSMGFLNPEVNTPNLDRLAKRGTYFNRCYTVNPTCTPTRASWITGMYPSQHGAYSLGTKLMESVPTVGDRFQENGYRTALVGKAHFQPLRSTEEYPSLESVPIMQDLEFWREFTGPFYGFDHIELARNHTDEAHVGQHYGIWMEEKGYANWRDYFHRNDGETRHTPLSPGDAWEIPEEIHYNAWIAERTNALMQEFHESGENFFLWASFFDPHPQYMVPEPYASMYDPSEVTVPEFVEGEFDDKPPHFALTRDPNGDWSRYRTDEGKNAIHGGRYQVKDRETLAKNIATMYGMMTMLDDYIGKILDQLDALGLAETTLIVFTTDHGDFWGQHGLTAKAIHHYEDLLKVPMIAAQPGVIAEDTRSDAIQSTVDLAPTFLGFADIAVPRVMTGLNMQPEWTGASGPLRTHAIVENRHNPTTMFMKTYIDERYKMTIHFNQAYGEIYDLQEDPEEYANLWDHPDCQELKKCLLLKFLYADMAIEPMPMPRIWGA